MNEMKRVVNIRVLCKVYSSITFAHFTLMSTRLWTEHGNCLLFHCRL